MIQDALRFVPNRICPLFLARIFRISEIAGDLRVKILIRKILAAKY